MSNDEEYTLKQFCSLLSDLTGTSNVNPESIRKIMNDYNIRPYRIGLASNGRGRTGYYRYSQLIELADAFSSSNLTNSVSYALVRLDTRQRLMRESEQSG